MSEPLGVGIITLRRNCANHRSNNLVEEIRATLVLKALPKLLVLDLSVTLRFASQDPSI